MFLRVQAYQRPGDVHTALSLLTRSDSRPLAGGTAAVGPVDADTTELVDLGGLGLRYIRGGGTSVTVGAMTTLDDMLRAPELFLVGGGVLAQAIERTGPPTLLVRATIGGTVASPDVSGELVAALLALDARVRLVRLDSTGCGLVRQELDLHTYMAWRKGILPGALIEEVTIPNHPLLAALERVARTPRDIPAVAVVAALHVEHGVCHDVRLAAAGLAPQPVRLKATEQVLEGAPLTEETLHKAMDEARAHAIPPDDFRGSAEYRRHLAGVLTRRALVSAVWPQGRM